MAKPKLTTDDFIRAAKKLKCEVAAIQAVAHVESRGEGFYSDGFPVILFERHKFRQFTNSKYNSTHPIISGPAGNYGAAGQNQRNKFNAAFTLNPVAAMKSCSWGKFQIMGFNHAVCGYATVGDFIDAMKESEGKQLDAFVNFVINNGLADELRKLNWKGFARGYNGSGYAQNKYDTKMATAYHRFSKDSAAATAKDEPARSVDKVDAATSLGSENSNQTADKPPPIDQPTQAEGQTIVDVPQAIPATEQPDLVTRINTRFTALGISFTAAIAALWAAVKDMGAEIIVALIATSGVVLLIWIVLTKLERMSKLKQEEATKRQREAQAFELTKLQMQSAMNRNLQTVRVVPTPLENSDAPPEVV